MFKSLLALFTDSRQKSAQKQQTQQAHKLYNLLIKQCRQDWFFDKKLVRDDFTGRFDLLCLHAHMLFVRLKALQTPSKVISQTLFDFMFEQFDLALREDGVGDMSIGKHIKKMAQAFYGRAKAYDELLALAQDDKDFDQQLQILSRNLNSTDAEASDLKVMRAYILGFHQALLECNDHSILTGDWPDVKVSSFTHYIYAHELGSGE